MDVPEWYLVMRAARYMGVAPWVAEERSVIWRNRALMAESAEVWAENERNRRQMERRQ